MRHQGIFRGLPGSDERVTGITVDDRAYRYSFASFLGGSTNLGVRSAVIEGVKDLVVSGVGASACLGGAGGRVTFVDDGPQDPDLLINETPSASGSMATSMPRRPMPSSRRSPEP